MDELGIILLTLFMFLLVCGPMYRPICLTYMWVQDHRKYHPRTSQFQEARRKLSTVSECTSVGLEKLDLESGLHQTDAEPECPICIGSLFVATGTNVAGAGPMQTRPSQGAVGVLEESGGEAGPTLNSEHGRNVRAAASKWRGSAWRWREWKKSPVKTDAKTSDDDILTLKSCKHAFHAKCLSSWFLIGRYDCPVCRNHYWQSREAKTRTASAPIEPMSSGPVLGAESGRERGDDGSGVARPSPARLAVTRLVVPIM
ncbi:hypothetical protein CH35J_006485 [Colletotrichum higginsianum]|uniref:RING-type domain-containing protein n=1 Tax=Colletotrichum higginsianum TaxID=80884 RepID=A0A4T0W2P9_9PEZI|nr:hypothetical protein CH35J_006485 [Colletotrichum higginsianum]